MMDIETINDASNLAHRRSHLLEEIRHVDRVRADGPNSRYFLSCGTSFANAELLSLRPTEELGDYIIKSLKTELAIVEGKLRDYGVQF